jgi:hypothetical protein
MTMDSHGPVLILAAFGAGLLVILVLFGILARRAAILRGRTDVRVWEEVARRLGGELDPYAKRLRIRFTWNGREATVTDEAKIVFKLSKGSFGSVRFVLLGPSARDPDPREFRKLEGFPEVRYGVDHERMTRDFLSDPVRRVVRDLFAVSGGGTEILLDEQLRIAGRPRPDVKSLTRYAMLCLHVAQHAMVFAEQTTAVRVVESGATGAGTCQICGAALGGVLVRCSRCSTPHHADCWEYTGVCSTYGCGGTSVDV